MRKALLLIFASATLWGDYLFVLYDVGESVALAPVIEALEGEEVRVVRYGEYGRFEELNPSELLDADVVVTGTASKIQLQHIKHASGKTVAYYDNPLPIETISYAPLIREFEACTDLFLVPSRLAALTVPEAIVVGNPDLERYTSGEVEEGLLTYFGGYDPEFEAAFTAFLEGVAQEYPRVLIRPHPKTDGFLERGLIAQYPHVVMGDANLDAAEAVACSEVVACHRSSIGIKAAGAGKRVLYIGADGEISEPPTGEELDIPTDAVANILRVLH